MRGRKGGKHLTRILADGYTPTRSELEDAVLDLSSSEGSSNRSSTSATMRASGFRWGQLVVEADGAAWHDHKLAREDDVAAPGGARGARFRVIRVTAQVIAQPAQRQPPEREGVRRSSGPPARQVPGRHRGGVLDLVLGHHPLDLGHREPAGDQPLLGVLERALARRSSSVARHTSTAWLEMP